MEFLVAANNKLFSKLFSVKTFHSALIESEPLSKEESKIRYSNKLVNEMANLVCHFPVKSPKCLD